MTTIRARLAAAGVLRLSADGRTTLAQIAGVPAVSAAGQTSAAYGTTVRRRGATSAHGATGSGGLHRPPDPRR